MARPESPLMSRGVELVRQRLARGEHPRTGEVAELLGVHRISLAAACRRAGLTLPRGQPRRQE